MVLLQVKDLANHSAVRRAVSAWMKTTTAVLSAQLLIAPMAHIRMSVPPLVPTVATSLRSRVE